MALDPEVIPLLVADAGAKGRGVFYVGDGGLAAGARREALAAAVPAWHIARAAGGRA